MLQVGRIQRSYLKDFAVRAFSLLPAGQPTPETHPHLLSSGEVTPGITAASCASRRQALLERIPADHAIVLVSAAVDYWSHDVPRHYRQDADFNYLTGFVEPDSVAVISRSQDESPNLTMFVQPRDPKRELWTGLRSGAEGACERFGADQAYATHDLETHLTKCLPDNVHTVLLQSDSSHLDRHLLKRVHRVCARLDRKVSAAPPTTNVKQTGMNAATRTETQSVEERVRVSCNAQFKVERMRLRKAPEEVQLMRSACQLSAVAHARVMEYAGFLKKQGKVIDEASAAAMFEFVIASSGGNLAYPSVVAGGTNALILHYVENRQKVDSGDLVLLDGGAELNHYSGDITRTWPVSGKYTRSQHMLYDVVLDCQTTLIDELRSQKLKSLLELHRRSVDLLRDGLSTLGIEGDIRRFYPHSVGHFLGMDVHDTPTVANSEELPMNSIITLEPALYIPSDTEDVPPEFRGIGIRTEDNILIGQDGQLENLTSDAPKTVSEIENTIANASLEKIFL